jgi:tetratricopeptide (TPR) repeat protein
MAKTKYIYSLLTLLSFFALSNKISAQNKLNLSDVDKLSYEYYNSQKWDELIKVGKKAKSQDISFYYLDYRMGVAYYSLKKYRKAITYFDKVVKQTPNDAIAKEYLYYSYLFGGRISDATNTMYTLEKSHRKKVEFHNSNSLFNGLGFEYKYYSFGDYAINETVNSDVVQKVRNSMNYFSADLMNYTQNNSTFSFNFSAINGNNSVFDKKYSDEIIDEKLKQLQFYVKWNKRLTKGVDMTISLAYMRENLDWYYTDGGNGQSSHTYNISTNNMVAFASLNKSIGNIDLAIGSTISMINNYNQAQPFATLKWYPFSNKSFYTNTTVLYQYNFEKENENNNFVFKQSLNAEINSQLSFSAYGLYGKVYNFVDNEGASIYNNIDAINYWYGLSANYYFNSLTQMYISYRNDGQTNDYTDTDIDKNIDYNINSILIGFRFNF